MGLSQRRLDWSHPGLGCGPSGFLEARRAGGITSAWSRRRVPGIPAPRLRGGRGERASSGGGEGCSRGATTGAHGLEPGTPIPAELTTRLGARGPWSLPTPRRDDRRYCRRSGVTQLGDSRRGGREASVPTQLLAAQRRGGFYSDTAGARLCLVMVTCARSAPPPARSDGGAGAWTTEAEPKRGHGGVSERPAPALRARRAGSVPEVVPGGQGTRRRGSGRLGVPAAPGRARRAPLESCPFVGQRDLRGDPETTQAVREAQRALLGRGPGEPGALGV